MNHSYFFHRDPADSFYTDNYPDVEEVEPCTCLGCGSSCSEDGIVTCDDEDECGRWWASREQWAAEATLVKAGA